MTLNVNRDVEDSFYRYKMPRLLAKVEGRGNGIKTVIVNMTEISKSLYRRPTYPTKYFGFELGAQIYVDEKNERYIVNGSHEASKLQELLYGFIKKFVLCSGCGNPETVLSVKRKAGIVIYKCAACGYSAQLDPKHRLTQYVLKNPPESRADGGGTTRPASKPTEPETNDSGDDRPQASPKPEDSENEEIDWGEDVDAGQAKRIADLSKAAKKMTVSVDMEKTQNELLEDFFNTATTMFKAGTLATKSNYLKVEADKVSLRDGAVMVLMEVIFQDPKKILNDIVKYKVLMQTFSRTRGPKAQGYVLHGMEKLIEKFSEDKLLNKACHILKALYDNDIVEEKTVIEWYKKGPSKRYVSKNLSGQILGICEPMVTWLQEADEEDSESEETAATPQQIVSNGVIKSHSCNGETLDNVKEESDDDLDIDNI